MGNTVSGFKIKILNRLKRRKTNTYHDVDTLEKVEEEVIHRGLEGRRAILVGLNYPGTSAALHGCINDVSRMKQTLISRFSHKNVTIYTDNDLSVQKNILQVLDELIGSKEKKLFFQYSGHGTQVKDWNGDEADGLDEALYSVKGTIITDDDINERVKKVPTGSTLVMIIDACHSGSMIDLPYQLEKGKIIKINDNKIDSNIICISGCRDNQVSMDVNDGFVAYGAMSSALNAVLNKNPTLNLTWKELIYKMNDELRSNRYAQVPLLSVSHPELILEKVDM